MQPVYPLEPDALKLPLALTMSFLLTATCFAGVLIDDFTDNLTVELPAQLRERVYSSSDIGPFSERLTYLSAILATPTGRFDVNGTNPSAATYSIPTTEVDNSRGIEPTGPAISLTYDDPNTPTGTIDLTDGGTANAILYDFGRLTASYPSWRIEASVRSAGSSTRFTRRISPAPYSVDPMTVSFPFDSFVVDRGSAQDVVDFSAVTEFSLFMEVAFLDRGLPEELNLDFVLNRIRTGVVVPEPSYPLAFCFGIVACLSLAERRKRPRRA